jgi:hypothetical protein
VIVRPGNLDGTCRFGALGDTLPHDWAPVEHYYRRGLRVALLRCRACDAFTLSGHGGHRQTLEEWLEDALPIPSCPAYGSFEQPGSEHLRERLPRKRSAA